MPDGKEKSPLAKYDEAAEYAYYDAPLREALRKKNPTLFDKMVAEKQAAYQRHLTEDKSPFSFFDMHKIVPKLIREQGWNDSLSEDEMKEALAKVIPVDNQDPYTRFMELRKNKELGGTNYGVTERYLFNGYSPQDLGAQIATSWEDAGSYYRPTIENGKLVRKTNLGTSPEEALRKFMERNKNVMQ